ncbi:hypothetical protein C0J50_15512 [Silurus asotus]|uniref:Uncharacterized protein n=1 Tax=Silurus asotus TaxID=30991 RepID=A0AAD5AXQ1_SILAS|nr:hypothetical protein C0J50_15512 [Silurus asotus]
MPRKSTLSCLSGYHPIALTPIVMNCIKRLIVIPVVKVLAVPVVLGFASLRVYSMSEDKQEVRLSPQQTAPSSGAMENTLDIPVSDLAQAIGTNELFHEVPGPSKSSLSHLPDNHYLVQAPLPVPHSSSPFADEELLVVTAEGKPSSASSLTAESQPEMPSLQFSGEPQTPTVVSEKQAHVADLNLKDFGQSNPEDADLYSTRS